jgi:ABC-2 type transport system ATP-binding protein
VRGGRGAADGLAPQLPTGRPGITLLVAMTAAIELHQLSKRYGPTIGVDGLDLTVEPGEVFGFLGPNGAGKTTTIRCLVGLLRPTSGRARVLGLDPLADHRRLALRIGHLPGELRLYGELSGAQHLRLLADLQEVPTPRRAELCERLELGGADLTRPVRDWSRGMKQKLGLVQAFQHDPEVLILDEPTEGLDPLVQESFFSLLDQARRDGRTVFLSSHILPVVQRSCGRVAIIRAGRLATVQEVEALRDARARRVRLTFADGGERERLPLPARWSPSWSGRTLHLLVEGSEVVPALRGLLDRGVVDLAVEEAPLDEAFLAFYRQAEAEAEAARPQRPAWGVPAGSARPPEPPAGVAR